MIFFLAIYAIFVYKSIQVNRESFEPRINQLPELLQIKDIIKDLYELVDEKQKEVSNTQTIASTVKKIYKDVAKMSPEQQVKFKYNAKFKHMKLDDYKDWLSLYENDKEGSRLLSAEHEANFKKFKEGTLEESDIPKHIDLEKVPTEADKYFDNIYALKYRKGDKRYKYFETEKLNPSYPVISENGGPWVSANYSEMSEFIPPKLLKHLKPPLPLADRDIDALVETRPVISKYYDKS